jgi:hypothetical protein
MNVERTHARIGASQRQKLLNQPRRTGASSSIGYSASLYSDSFRDRRKASSASV